MHAINLHPPFIQSVNNLSKGQLTKKYTNYKHCLRVTVYIVYCYVGVLSGFGLLENMSIGCLSWSNVDVGTALYRQRKGRVYGQFPHSKLSQARQICTDIIQCRMVGPCSKVDDTCLINE